MSELLGREIFAVGKWNGLEFTEADLDDIAANFELLSAIHRVPLKFGHNDEQPMTDGQPAIGWVNRVYRQGKKLLADFVDMPKTVLEAVQKKLYRTVSIELLFDVEHRGDKFAHVLDAVALLGADHPAVNTLADLDALTASRTSFSGGRRLCFETMAGTPLVETKVINMDDKELKQAVSEAVALAVEPLQKQLEEVTKERDKFMRMAEKAEGEKLAFEAEQKRQRISEIRNAVTGLLDDAVRDKKMTPAMREVYSAQIGVDSDDRVLQIDVDQVKLMCSATTKDDAESGQTRTVDTETYTDPADELTQRTRKFMAEHNERNFRRALEAVARANPDLHKQYLDSNVEG